MKKILLGLMAFVAAARVFAVTPNPYTLSVSFSCRAWGVGNAILTVNGEPGDYVGVSSPGGGFEDSDVKFAWLRPGKVYNLELSRSGLSSVELNFTAPDGYAVYLDGAPTDFRGVSMVDGISSYPFQIELRPIGNSGRLAAGTFSGFEMGKSISWEIGLGGLRTGRSAGRIFFKEIDLTGFNGAIASRDRLYYAPPNNWGEITVVRDSNSALKQIGTPQSVVDLVDETAGGYSLKFYAPSQATYSSGSYSFTGSPWRTIRVESPATNKMKVTETEGSVSRVSLMDASAYNTNYTWTLKEGSASTYVRTVTHVSSVPASGQRDVIESVYTGDTTATSALVARTKYHYVQKSWGEELDQLIKDPDTAQLTTSFTYHETVPVSGSEAQRGNFRRVKSVTEPTGNWAGYEYFDEWSRRGQIQTEYHPFVDAPAAVSFSSSSGRVITYEYDLDWSGRRRLPTTVEEKTNGITTAKSIGYHSQSTDAVWPRTQSTTIVYRDASNYESSRVDRFNPDDYNPDESSRPYQSTSAAGGKSVWASSRGTLSGSTFTVSGIGSNWREIKVNGSIFSGDSDAQLTTWGGLTFESIYVVPGHSTIETTICDPAGNVVRMETWLYTGSSSFVLMTWEDRTFDDAGRLTGSVASNGATVSNTYANGLLANTTDAAGTNTTFSYDELGRVKSSRKDGVAATAAELTSGYNYAAQADIYTHYVYDGAGHVLKTLVTTASSWPTSYGATDQLSTAAVDLAGRKTQEVANAASSSYSLTTGIGYSANARVTTVTRPGGATEISENYLDGQAKQVTGTGVVANYFVHNIQSDGRHEFVHRQVSTSGPVVEYVYRDWLNRDVLREVPSPSGSGYLDQWWFRDSRGLVWKVLSPGKAPTLYAYDTMGRLKTEALSVNGDDTIDFDGTDRIKDYLDYGYQYSSGATLSVWTRHEERVYATESSSSATTTGIHEDYLRGTTLNGTLQTLGYNQDIYGNNSPTKTEVYRSAKKVKKITLWADTSNSEKQIFFNGLLVESCDKAGVTMRFEYDSIGRRIKVIDPRTAGTNASALRGTVTVFKANTSLVDTVTDPAGFVQQAYDYDASGAVKSCAVPNPHYGVGADTRARLTTYYSYNTRGQKTREWGDAGYPVEYRYDSQGRRDLLTTYGRSTANFANSTWPASPDNPSFTKWAYHASTGALTSQYDAANLDSTGEPISSGAKKIQFTYNNAGQLWKKTLARTSSGTPLVVTNTYDAATGDLKTVTYSDGTPSVSYTYNRLGRVSQVTDASGTRTFNYALTTTLEMTSEDLPSFFGSRRITYPISTSGYLGRSAGLQLGSAGTPTADQSVGYTYDSYGRLQTITAATQTFTYSYVTNSNLIDNVANGSYQDARLWESNHDWLQARQTSWGATNKLGQYRYFDQLGRTTTTASSGEIFARYGNGTQGLTKTYAYDDRSEVRGEKTFLGGTSTLVAGRDNGDDTSPGFTYDLLGNRKTVTHNGVTANYTVNALNQYTQRDVPGTFDVAGFAPTASAVTVGGASTARQGDFFFLSYLLTNTSSATFNTLGISVGGASAGSIDAFVPQTPESFTNAYDDDGNLTQDGRWQYFYDAENRLIEMRTRTAVMGSSPLLPNANAQRLVFSYDYLGRRISKTVYLGYSSGSFSPTSSDETKYVYSGWNIIATLNAKSSNALVASYYWGLDLTGSFSAAGGVGGLVMIQEGTAKLLPAYDCNGNLLALMTTGSVTLAGTTYAAGDLVAAYEYDAFGQTIRETGAYAASNPFRFSTKFADLETGLVYYGLRYYSPSLGRFVNRDPKGEEGGLNLYAFCRNNGVNSWDYLGMDDGFTIIDKQLSMTSDGRVYYDYGRAVYANRAPKGSGFSMSGGIQWIAGAANGTVEREYQATLAKIQGAGIGVVFDSGGGVVGYTGTALQGMLQAQVSNQVMNASLDFWGANGSTSTGVPDVGDATITTTESGVPSDFKPGPLIVLDDDYLPPVSFGSAFVQTIPSVAPAPATTWSMPPAESPLAALVNSDTWRSSGVEWTPGLPRVKISYDRVIGGNVGAEMKLGSFVNLDAGAKLGMYLNSNEDGGSELLWGGQIRGGAGVAGLSWKGKYGYEYGVNSRLAPVDRPIRSNDVEYNGFKPLDLSGDVKVKTPVGDVKVDINLNPVFHFEAK